MPRVDSATQSQASSWAEEPRTSARHADPAHPYAQPHHRMAGDRHHTHGPGRASRLAMADAPAQSKAQPGLGREYLGVPYRWGGTSRRGIDCSGLTQRVMQERGMHVPRTAAAQYQAGRPVSSHDLKPGDLVFFKNTGSRRGITHVGIYQGNGVFVHAPRAGKTVTTANLNDPYYANHFAGARRFA